MGKSTEMLIYEMSLRVRLFRMFTGSENNPGNLTDREILILELLSMKDSMSISEIGAITKLWKENKLVNKQILPENQRVTAVSLTDEGRSVIEEIKRTKSKIYSTIGDYHPKRTCCFKKSLLTLSFFSIRNSTWVDYAL
jgi:DNA-binding MarR family transcriptional regulator